MVDGLPLCALDEHTRFGKQAINRLMAEDIRLRACLQQFVPKPRWSKAAQHAAFAPPQVRGMTMPLWSVEIESAVKFDIVSSEASIVMTAIFVLLVVSPIVGLSLGFDKLTPPSVIAPAKLCGHNCFLVGGR